jgi:sarcosine oxidase
MAEASFDILVVGAGIMGAGAGFGGHGFKFAPAIGRMLAGLVEGGSAPAKFSLSRFAGSVAHAG